jgi:predicted PurR-regulated permease PerM
LRKETIRGYCIVAAFTVILYLGLSNLASISGALNTVARLFTPFLIGIVLAFIVNFLMRAFEKHVFCDLAHHKYPIVRKLLRPLSLLCSYFLLFLFLALLLTVVVPQFVTSLSILSKSIPQYLYSLQSEVEQLIARLNLDPAIIETVSGWFWQMMNSLPNFLLGILSSVPQLAGMVVSLGGGVINAVIGLIVSIHILLNKETLFFQMDRIVRAFLPERSAKQVRGIAVVASHTFTNYVSGQLLDALFVGIVSVLGLWLFRFPYFLLIGVIMGVTNVIPFFGPFIGAVPGFIILLMVSPVKAFLYIIFVLVVQQVDGNIIAPKIIGESVGLPPLWVLFAVTIGGGLFGIPGMVLGTPVFAIFYFLFGRLVKNRLHETDKPSETETT